MEFLKNEKSMVMSSEQTGYHCNRYDSLRRYVRLLNNTPLYRFTVVRMTVIRKLQREFQINKNTAISGTLIRSLIVGEMSAVKLSLHTV